MHDWTGSTVQREALTVPCRFCHAVAGEPCVTDGRRLVAFPAHTTRIGDAKAAADKDAS